jgi:hypothetical protein
MVFSALFLLILVAEHFLEPEFDPKWRMISEYEIGRYGWLMRIAFFCWGAGMLFITLLAWVSAFTPGGKVGRWWFIVIVLALFGAGIFKTNAITDNSSNRDNTLHSIFGTIVILTFPIASTLVGNSLIHNPFWAGFKALIIVFTILNWLAMIGFFASIILSRKKDPTAGRVGPNVLLGWPNRFLVVVYNAWIIMLAVSCIQFLN